MTSIAGIAGKQYVEGSPDYENRAYQYATSTYGKERKLNPANVIYPQNVDDIRAAVKYAKDNKIAIAIRTGGHQYSGASSTTAPNIQLDLSTTFQDPDDRKIIPAGADTDGETWLYTSVSWTLKEFNGYMKQKKVFIPHGQCSHVHLGGHVQTGGYGQLGRSFGLLGDHIRVITIVDSDGNVRDVSKKSNPDLFYAMTGGSPGNFGVITHATLQVHNDADHEGALGLKAIWLYNKQSLKRLLDLLVDMSDDENFPRNYDFCVSVLSSTFKITSLLPDIDSFMRLKKPEIFGKDHIPLWPRSIIVYAQWVPFSKTDKPDLDWFRKIEQGSFFNKGIEKLPMSQMTGNWIFNNVREFNHPYVKRTYMTKSHTLARDGWVDWIIGRIDALVAPIDNDCYLSCQIQNFGGKNSMFYQNRNNGTAYSWRDSSMCVTIDAFHGPLGFDFAKKWQKENDAGMIGPNSKFSKEDRRVLWGSYGEFDFDKVWQAYHESKEKYEKIGKARQAADPNGIFTPNTFAVKRFSGDGTPRP